MTNAATALGSMPGVDLADSTRVVVGELPDLPHLVELPERGAPAAMVGRTLAMVTDLGADLQPAGWRLTDAAGMDQRRATSLLAQDLDMLEEQTQGYAGRLKVQVAGPWTLAATVERPRGDRVLGDHGARRDPAQALAAGITAHVFGVRRRVPGADIVVQVDEPGLPAVLAGAVPTASGFSRHRSVSAPDAARAIDWVVAAANGAGASTVLHCCHADLPWDLLAETAVEAVSFDLAHTTPANVDAIAGWVESGRAIWPGVVASLDPPTPWPRATDLTHRIVRWWADLGFTDLERLPSVVVTPICGLAGASPGWARTALALSHDVARNMSVEQGRME